MNETHIDLFSGIGGFALAAERVWPDIKHIFVDNDAFCQEVIRKHWPEAEIYGDIRTLTNPRSKEQRGLSSIGEEKIPETGQVYLLTGGFPCQPFSQAGRRRGTQDDRYLWPEMFRVIREFKPRWVVGENVAGLLTIEQGLVFEQACSDLEKEGYEVQPFIIPAVAVNAPHRRDRAWIVANRNDTGSGTSERKTFTYGTKDSKERQYPLYRADGQDNDASDTKGAKQQSKRGETRHRRREFGCNSWNKNWIEVATRLCRVDDGLPRRLDRNPRLKALGNAIVPQVAEQIFRGIKEVETLLDY